MIGQVFRFLDQAMTVLCAIAAVVVINYGLWGADVFEDRVISLLIGIVLLIVIRRRD